MITFSLSFISLILSGCEEKKDILDRYAGGRLGVILESKNHRPGLSSTLIDYINKRVDMQVVNPELLIGAEDYPITHTKTSTGQLYRDKLGLDLLLTVKLSDLLLKKNFPSFQWESEYMEIKVTYSCLLTLSYILHDLHSGKVLNLGQSSGNSKKSIQIGAGKDNIKIHNVQVELEEVDRSELIEKAMLNALGNTDLL